ncbi:hypothetical protein B0T36_05135 [Nocardia donostiensis]|nr:hypothetical protein B0T36_05135 [Nocardia donostiensis]
MFGSVQLAQYRANLDLDPGTDPTLAAVVEGSLVGAVAPAVPISSLGRRTRSPPPCSSRPISRQPYSWSPAYWPGASSRHIG